MARKKLSYRERIEQIGNKLTNLALKLEKQAEEGEDSRISSNMGNTIVNCLKSSADIFKYLDSIESQTAMDVEVNCGLSKGDRAKLDQMIELLKES